MPLKFDKRHFKNCQMRIFFQSCVCRKVYFAKQKQKQKTKQNKKKKTKKKNNSTCCCKETPLTTGLNHYIFYLHYTGISKRMLCKTRAFKLSAQALAVRTELR